MGSYQLLIPDIQPNIVLSEPLSADNHFVLSKVEDQEGLVQESSSSHNQMEYDGMCDLWSIWAAKSSYLYRLSQGFSRDVVEVG